MELCNGITSKIKTKVRSLSPRDFSKYKPVLYSSVDNLECTLNITLVLNACLIAIYYMVSEVKDKDGHITTTNANVEENFRTWFQKFELYIVALEKNAKTRQCKMCSISVHCRRKNKRSAQCTNIRRSGRR